MHELHTPQVREQRADGLERLRPIVAVSPLFAKDRAEQLAVLDRLIVAARRHG